MRATTRQFFGIEGTKPVWASDMRVRIALLASLLVPTALGCHDRDQARPTAASDGSGLDRADASAQPSGSAAAASASSAEPAPPTSAAEAAPSGDSGLRHAAPVGGNWLKCYAEFQPRTRPELDVMRLGLMCGPSNGMKKLTAAPEADIREGDKREHRWRASVGDCYRIFAVASPDVKDLDVEVLDPKGKRIAFDTSDDRWPVVNADGAFCAFEDGDYRALVKAQRGSGRYAMEIWRLH